VTGQRTFLLLALPILAVGVAATTQRSPGNDEDKKGATKKVPLDSIYSTSGQNGLKLLAPGHGDGLIPNEMRELHRQGTRFGASNVFLARVDDYVGAVKATWEVFTHGQSASAPVNEYSRPKSVQYWLVAYLGVAGSEPLEWRVKSAEVQRHVVRLTYTKEGAKTNDVHPYFVWVPLGELKAGTYSLELFEQDLKQATLSRRVTVSEK
jgi:hypothetical protein